MPFPMIGKKYHVKFPSMSFFLDFLDETRLRFIVEKSPDLPPGSSHTVAITVEPLRDELYMVSWQEASGNTIVHIEDLKNHEVHAFLTMKNGLFIRQDAPLLEVGSIE
jgi:hypothetical protein